MSFPYSLVLFQGQWFPSEMYNVGDIVHVMNNYFFAIKNNQNKIPGLYTEYWQPLSGTPSLLSVESPADLNPFQIENVIKDLYDTGAGSILNITILKTLKALTLRIVNGNFFIHNPTSTDIFYKINLQLSGITFSGSPLPPNEGSLLRIEILNATDARVQFANVPNFSTPPPSNGLTIGDAIQTALYKLIRPNETQEVSLISRTGIRTYLTTISDTNFAEVEEVLVSSFPTSP